MFCRKVIVRGGIEQCLRGGRKKILKGGRVIQLSGDSASLLPKRWNPALLLQQNAPKLRPRFQNKLEKYMKSNDKENKRHKTQQTPFDVAKETFLQYSEHQIQRAQNFFRHAKIEWRILHTIEQLDPKVVENATIHKRGRSTPLLKESDPALASPSPSSSSSSSSSPSMSSSLLSKLSSMWPQLWVPEIVMMGRSNVGKSSLLNALLGTRCELLRVSRSPGTTQQIHLLDLVLLDTRLRLVDVPGYGYAEASSTTTKEMSNLLRAYLLSRLRLSASCLRQVFLLVDSPLGLDDKDREILQLCTEHTCSSFIVLTKADKLNQSELSAMVSTIEQEIIAKWSLSAFPRVLITSALTRLGIPELQTLILDLCTVPWQQK
jgi:GTP-binding protein